MKKNLFILFWLQCIASFAQVIENPAFTNSDVPAFHVTKVEITNDTTYVYCSYFAEAGSWASISPEIFLRDSESHKKYPLLRCEGLPYSPETKDFPQNQSCELLFCFPSIAGTKQFDFIECEGEIAFNIYNISLNEKFKTSYTDAELKQIMDVLLEFNPSRDTENKIILNNYITSLHNLGSYKASIGNYAEAIRLGTIEVKIKEKTIGIEDPTYIETIGNLAHYYSAMGNYAEAIHLQADVVNKTEMYIGTDNAYYATSLRELALYNVHAGNYLEAIRLGTETVEIYKKVYGFHHPYYAISLDDLAVFYAYIGNYSEAILLGKEAMIIKKDILGKENSDYAQSLNNLAGYYSDIGNYSEAIILGEEAVKIKKGILGTENPEYALSLRNLAMIYSQIGDNADALKLGKEVLDIRKRVLGTEHPDYARSLNDLAIIYSISDNYNKALHLLLEAARIRGKILGLKHPDYAWTLNDLALCYARIGKYNDAVKIGKDALEIRKMVLGTEHPDYASSLNDLAECNFRIGNYAEAIKLGIEALELRKKIFGVNHPIYARSLLNLSLYYYNNGYYLEAYNYAAQYVECTKSFIFNIFSELSSHFQETLWKGSFAFLFVNALPSLVYKYRNKESVSMLFDNTCLFAKGLLLNTGVEMRKLILESSDTMMIKRYKALSTNICKYNKLIERPIRNHYMNADSLKNIIQNQEMELARESKVFGDYTRNISITWKDVQRALGEDDIAIEFLDYPLIGTDSTMYVALTLKKGYDSPHMNMLFERKQLKEIPENIYYNRNDVFDLVWKPLEGELKGVRNIYFAPSGDLHRIGIEYLPISKTENICDRFTIHRLSSTRQLAVIQDDTKGENNIIYGGINYDEKSSTISLESTSTNDPAFRDVLNYRANVESLSLRSSIDYLEGTKREADMIAENMKQHRVPYIYYCGTDGTEESFKHLDGLKTKTIHIATHGFYLTEIEAKKSKFVRPDIEINPFRSIEDKPMTRSGLLFSGCNRAFRHEQIPENEEDGILTAQEISMLDLRGLDLVVLSACQTGLGDLISGEGVFGLQRGLKKAGAKTILMSLNVVDDDATRILMVEFYRNLMDGKPKYQSLKDAQKYLRQVDNGKYDDPKYWASFIMLDGIN